MLSPMQGTGYHAPAADAQPMGKMVVDKILDTHDDEIGCDDCFDQLDEYVAKELVGTDASKLMPRVHVHLERCKDCSEEHDALVRALSSG